MTDLIDTTEMYLRTIFELEEEGIVPAARPHRRAAGALRSDRLARPSPGWSATACSASPATATSSCPTDGRPIATRVMRKHRLAERLLVDVIGLEWEYVHDEACRWEHVMSERVERKILALLERPPRVALRQPDPRPRRAGRRRARPRTSASALHSLTELAGETPEPSCVVRRIGEPVQVDHEALSLLTVARLLPGAAGAGAPCRRPRGRRPRGRTASPPASRCRTTSRSTSSAPSSDRTTSPARMRASAWHDRARLPVA